MKCVSYFPITFELAILTEVVEHETCAKKTFERMDSNFVPSTSHAGSPDCLSTCKNEYDIEKEWI